MAGRIRHGSDGAYGPGHRGSWIQRFIRFATMFATTDGSASVEMSASRSRLNNDAERPRCSATDFCSGSFFTVDGRLS
jgi:hypothetical protein